MNHCYDGKMLLTKNFIQNVVGTWGEAGSSWIESLVSLVKDFAEEWQLKNLQVSQHLSYNYVVFAEQTVDSHSQPVVLKLCMPTQDMQREIQALIHYNGDGAVRLLKSDIKKGALLLQALSPGKQLKLFFPDQDKIAIEITAEVIKRLHKSPVGNPQDFPSIQDWAKTLDEPFKDIPLGLLKKARQLAKRLIDTQGSVVLLHGDLHHENILLNGQDEWLAIDPKGVIGEIAYEVGAFMRNPMPEILDQLKASDLLALRFEAFSKLLSIDKQRIVEWSFVQAILAACWSIEDNIPHAGRWLELAEIMNKQHHFWERT